MSSTTRKSNDVFHRLPESTLKSLIAESTSIRQVFIKMGLCVSGDHYRPFRKIVEELNIDLSHFNGQYTRGLQFKTEHPIETVFALDTHYSSITLSRKIRKHKLLPYKCVKCANPGEWNNSPLSLQLDHINGINTDNRIENLRFLCPNCHSQTDTFCGRHKKAHYHCVTCGRKRSKKATHCHKCSSQLQVLAIKWPTDAIVKDIVWKMPMPKAAHHLRVSIKSLKKHCRNCKIEWPPMGYWQRRQAGHPHEKSLTSCQKVRPQKRIISKEQLSKMKEMQTQGASNREIATTIGFHHTTVGRALKRMEH